MATDWQRALVALATVTIGALVLAALYFGRQVLIPVALAAFLTFVLSPLVTRLQRAGLGRTISVLATVGLVLLLVLGVGAALAMQITQLAETLPDKKDTIVQKVLAAKSWFTGNGSSRFGELVNDVSQTIAPDKPGFAITVQHKESSLASQLSGYVNPVAMLLVQLAFTFILCVFMLLHRQDLRSRVIRLIGSRKITTTTRAVDDASRRISRYLLNQALLNASYGSIVALGTFLLGLDYSLLWGVLAAFMRYVPYLGTWIGLIPPLLYSVATAPDWGGGWGQPLGVLALFATLELVCNNLIEPRLYGKSMGVSEVAQLISVAFWAFLWGPIGLILAGPLTVCLLVLGRHVKRFEAFAVLLGDEPALPPCVAFYQRLAARDQDEAAEIAMTAAADGQADEVLDTVIAPALCQARHDLEDGDLDTADFQFAMRAAREIAEQVNELREPWQGNGDDERVRVLVCPMRDEADHAAADLFAMSLNPRRWEVKVTGDETLASEVLELVETFQPHAVVLAVLPPGGVSHTRYVQARLRRHHPDLPVLIGRWGCNAETPVQNAESIDRAMAGTRKRLADQRPQLMARPASASEKNRIPETIGTTPA